MALQKLALKPGVNKEGTNYANENGFYNSDKVRFRSGYAEKIGGWSRISSYTFIGLARSLWNWITLASENLLAVGTTQKFYVENGGKYYDITPIRTIRTITGAFVPTNGKIYLTVNDPDSGVTSGSFVYFTQAYGYLNSPITVAASALVIRNSSGGFISPSGTVLVDSEEMTYTTITANAPSTGLYTLSGLGRGANGTVAVAHPANTIVSSKAAITVGGVNINREFEVVDTPDSNAYVVDLPANASNSTPLSGTYYGIYQINAGNSSLATQVGWGIVPWNTGAWGVGVPGTVTSVPFRLWSITNYDQDLIFAARLGSIYWWTKDTSAYSRAVTLNDYANTQVKTVVTASWLSGVSYITVANTDGINIGSVISGSGSIPAGAYVDTTWDYSTQVPIAIAPSTAAVTTAPGTNVDLNFSYSGRHVPIKTLVVNTSSANAFTIAFGATPYDPTTFSNVANFDPLLIRWSDQDNPAEWVPEVTNQSGEQRVASGSVIVTTSYNRQEILVWTDTALYSMQYIGPPYVFGINLVMDNISIASQNSAITVNNVAYWMGVDKFYVYAGRVDTLPCTLRQFVFNNINKSQLQQVVCGTNEAFNEIWWFYPTGTSQINDSYVVFNHVEQLWYYGTISRTGWLDSQLRQYPLGVYSTQSSYLIEDISNSVTSITVVNGSGFPSTGTVQIDNEQITYGAVNGNQLLNCTRGAFGTTKATHTKYAAVNFYITNSVLFHEYGYDDGTTSQTAPIYAYIDSSDFDIGDGLNFAYVWRIIPDLSFTGSTVPTPKCALTVRVRQNSGAAYTAHSTDTQTVTRTATYPVEVYTGQVYTRVRGRQMAFRMESSDLGVFWQMGMMRIDLRQDGRR